jgi:HopA1 effector protein family
MSQENQNIESFRALSESISFANYEIRLKGLNKPKPLSKEGLEDIIYLFYQRRQELDSMGIEEGYTKNLLIKYPSDKRHTWANFSWKQIKIKDDLLQPNNKGDLIVKKGSQLLLSRAGNYLLVSDSVGSPFVTLSYPSVFSDKFNKDSYTTIVGKFYSADIDDNPNVVRFYFNIKPSSKAVINIVDQIQQRFDWWGLPFRFKFLNRLAYSRADTGVLYISKKYFFVALNLIKQVCEKKEIQETFLNKEVPHFTYKVTDGIGFAEEPITHQTKIYSFGTWTAYRISEAIFEILGGDLIGKAFPTAEQLIDVFKDRIPNLHLNENSNFPYNFDWVNRMPSYIPISNAFFGEANTIARILCNEAVWIKENQCTWLTYGENDNNNFFRAIDNSVMTGRAGVAIFLASMYRQNKDRLFRYVATSALNSIVENVTIDLETIKKDMLLWQGLSFVFKNVGEWFNEGRFIEISKRIDEHTTNFKTEIDEAPSSEIIVIDDALHSYRNMRRVISLQSTKSIPRSSKKQALEIKNQYLDQIKPYPNALLEINIKNETEFCPTLSQGLACIGYFFLKMSNQPNVLSIPYEFIDVG